MMDISIACYREKLRQCGLALLLKPIEAMRYHRGAMRQNATHHFSLQREISKVRQFVAYTSNACLIKSNLIASFVLQRTRLPAEVEAQVQRVQVVENLVGDPPNRALRHFRKHHVPHLAAERGAAARRAVPKQQRPRGEGQGSQKGCHRQAGGVQV